jgi:hypothetical protein
MGAKYCSIVHYLSELFLRNYINIIIVSLLLLLLLLLFLNTKRIISIFYISKLKEKKGKKERRFIERYVLRLFL